MSKTPQLCDIDGDGLTEILMTGSDGQLHIWDLACAHDTLRMPLSTFHYDKWRTGWYRLTTVALEDRPVPGAPRVSARATVVRGVLMLPRPGTRPGLSDNTVTSRAALLDAAGRKVMDLLPGENDVRHLKAGVYFVQDRVAEPARQVVLVR